MLAAPAPAQMAEGRLGEVGKDFVVVDGTRYSVDEGTLVRLLPVQDPDDYGVPPASPPEGAQAGAGAWVRYAPAVLDDVGWASITGTGRLAEQIRLQPHRPGGGE
ncbi:hypothetical protein [Thiohalorhabdus sp.]|uniref:hypothetical protein n=1 Tax=Thiohalorhabdus sp. TaxID=3094134 RepID=UPI002FC38946